MQFTNEEIEFLSRNLEEITKFQTGQVLGREGHAVEIFGPHKMAEMYKRASERRLELVKRLNSRRSFHHALAIQACIEHLDRVIGEQDQELG